MMYQLVLKLSHLTEQLHSLKYIHVCTNKHTHLQYTFIDSESNELEPHGMSKADETPRRETLRPTQTPNTSVRSSPKLSTPRPRNCKLNHLLGNDCLGNTPLFCIKPCEIIDELRSDDNLCLCLCLCLCNSW